jgi:hypothetical protein
LGLLSELQGGGDHECRWTGIYFAALRTLMLTPSRLPSEELDTGHCRLHRAVPVDAIRPFPKHCLQGGGNILRPGCIGCMTFGNPVPSEMRKGYFHINLTGTRSTRAMSLCGTELTSPSSQEMVTSLQDVPVTVPRSVVVAPQQTRSPILSVRDWSPVIYTSSPGTTIVTATLSVHVSENQHQHGETPLELQLFILTEPTV